MTIGFGLDLSGYSTRRTVLAAVEVIGDDAEAAILTGSAFSTYRHGVEDVRTALKEETAALRLCLDYGSLAVDVPIDLQGLPAPKEIEFIWELTKRPIDYALEALPPLSERLGACVARFGALLSTASALSAIGRQIFETYPAGSLRMLNLPNTGYKGTGGRAVRREIAHKLRFDQIDVSDDELDAIICAATIVAPANCRLEGAGLIERMHAIDPFTEMTPRGRLEPAGYVLLNRWPFRRVRVSVKSFQDWVEAARS